MAEYFKTVTRCVVAKAVRGGTFVGLTFSELGIATALIYGIPEKDRVIAIAN